MNHKKWMLVGCLGCVGLMAMVIGGFAISIIVVGHLELKRFERVADVPAPQMEGYPIYTPMFDTELGPVLAGTAFLATDPTTDAVYLLSAHHLLGESGGLPRDLAWDEVSEMVHSVTCDPYVQGFETITLTDILPIVDAQGLDDYSGADDLLVFRAPDSLRKHAIPLRLEPIDKDEPVWLFSLVSNRDVLLHLAVVDSHNEHFLEYSYEEAVTLQATSGAPIVDRHGRLVAVNLGGYSLGIVTGLGNPATAVKKRLDRAEKDRARSNPRESPR